MNAIKPTYYLHVWLGRKREILFAEIKNMNWVRWEREYDYHEVFIGEAATVRVGCNDYEIDRIDALDAATRFMKGQYTLIEIDLDKCISKQSPGVNLIQNPRQ